MPKSVTRILETVAKNHLCQETVELGSVRMSGIESCEIVEEYIACIQVRLASKRRKLNLV